MTHTSRPTPMTSSAPCSRGTEPGFVDAGHGEHPRGLADALELPDPSVLEPEGGAGDQLPERAGDQDLARTGQGREPGPRVDRHPAEPSAHDLGLADVDTGPDLDPERPNALNDRRCTANGLGRTVEGGEEAVAGGVDLPSPEPLELGSNDPVVACQELPPPPIAHLTGDLGRAHDVREQHRDQDGPARHGRSVAHVARERQTCSMPAGVAAMAAG